LGIFSRGILRTIWRFILSLQSDYPIWLLCEVLEVSRCCYYAWRKVQTSQVNDIKTMGDRMVDTFWENKRRFICRRVVAEFRNQGVRLSQYKVRKFLHKYGLKAI